MPIFTLDNLVPPDEVDLKTLRPFKKGETFDNQDGTISTERTTSFNINGKETLIPSLWMTPNGPVDLRKHPETMIRAAIDFEKRSKVIFPRFNSVEEAEEFSKNRSQSGAVATGELGGRKSKLLQAGTQSTFPLI